MWLAVEPAGGLISGDEGVKELEQSSVVCSDSLCRMLALAGERLGVQRPARRSGSRMDHGLYREVPGPHGKGKS